MNARIRQASIELMARNHFEDVNRLDNILGIGDSATLSNIVPPNPYVGNPSNLKPKECVALIGINPRLDLGRKGFKEFEINIPTNCQINYARTGNQSAFEPWFEKLHNFYYSDAYYGRYFTKLGNHIGRAWFTPSPEGEPAHLNARSVLSNHVLKIDAVPYYSENDRMVPEHVSMAMRKDPAMICHRHLIETLFEECKPRHLQVNGKNTAGEMIKSVFGESDTFEAVGKGNSSIEVGWGKIGKHELPILIHGFTNSPYGPQSPEAFEECVRNFETWLH